MSDEFQAWKNHFIEQAKGKIPHQKKFYRVSMQQGGGSQPAIKMVSPTEQIVERAKANIEHPPTVYDPVTGVMQQTIGKHSSISRKRRRKSHKDGKRISLHKTRKNKKTKINRTNKKKNNTTRKKQKWK
jgi:hypothetical protein